MLKMNCETCLSRGRVNPVCEKYTALQMCQRCGDGDKWKTDPPPALGPIIKRRSHPSRFLTVRELFIVRSFYAGQRWREIADALGIKRDTLKGEMCTIYNKLGCDDHVGAVLFALNRGLLSLDMPVRWRRTAA